MEKAQKISSFFLIVSMLPESSRFRSGLRLSTELRFDGIGKLGFGRFFNAASACWTASCRTSTWWEAVADSNNNNSNKMEKQIDKIMEKKENETTCIRYFRNHMNQFVSARERQIRTLDVTEAYQNWRRERKSKWKKPPNLTLIQTYAIVGSIRVGCRHIFFSLVPSSSSSFN